MRISSIHDVQLLCHCVWLQEIPFYGPPRPVAVQAGNVPEITKFHEWKVIDCPRVGFGLVKQESSLCHFIKLITTP